MVDLINPATFDFFARYFLAGFIIATVRTRYVTGERPSPGDVLYEAVILSLLNQLVFQALTSVATWFLPITPSGNIAWLIAASQHFSIQIETLLLPGVLGLLLGFGLKKGWNQTFLRALAMPVIHPTRRAYDYAFGDIKTTRFMIVTFSDGTIVKGYFGENSLASSDPTNGDIYIERLYSDKWVPSDPPKSALLMLRDLRSIEFIDPVMETADATQTPE